MISGAFKNPPSIQIIGDTLPSWPTLRHCHPKNKTEQEIDIGQKR
jgi:hypothetical protein